MKTLILTGWGWIGYATAAALALRQFKTADLLGMSKRRLPEHLTELASSGCQYKKIILIGVGLSGDSKELTSALKKLKQQQVEVVWLSVLEMPCQFSDNIKKYLNVHIDTKQNGITEFVSEFYHQPCDDLIKIRDVEYNITGSSVMLLARYLLVKSAQYRYRNYQDSDAYPAAIRTLAEKGKLSDEQTAMINHYKKYGARELKGRSPVMVRLHDIINKIGPKDRARVLIQGASGTGKETVAIHLHEKSPRRKNPFITFNCASTSTSLIESHLFGYVKGAFTGATKEKLGVFDEADGGTLFLDEIGELSLEVQANILRVLQEGCFNRVGGLDEVRVDVRIITATNRNLIEMVKAGTFREDLFYRLNVIPIYLPSLCEHLEDIKAIANNSWYKWHGRSLTVEQVKVLESYDWPGNVRELGNFLEYATALDENDFAKLLAEYRKRMEPMLDTTQPVLPENLEELTRQHAAMLLKKYENNISKTSEAMGITRNTLKKYLK
jgi:transcriptional regulator with PAS, ATPase and Fis domain